MRETGDAINRSSVLKRTLTAVLIAYTLLGAGCDREKGPDYVLERAEFGVPARYVKIESPLELRTSGDCDLPPSNGAAPSLYELKIFLSRIDVRRGVVVSPIDIKCISNKYSQREASRWAADGDPVAEYIVLFKKYRHIADICNNINSVNEALLSISEIKSVIYLNNTYINRVPEAYFLARRLKSECDGSGPFPIGVTVPSLAHGYDPLVNAPTLKPA